jgi:hypothetical protein
MIDHVMRSRDGVKIHVVELFDPLRIEYCTCHGQNVTVSDSMPEARCPW